MRRAIVAIAVCAAFTIAACSVLTLSELHDPPPPASDVKGADAKTTDAGGIDAPDVERMAPDGSCIVGPGASGCQLVAAPTDAGLTGIYYSIGRSKLFVASPSQGVFAVDPVSGESALIASGSAQRVLGDQMTLDGHLFVATRDAGVFAIRLPLDGGTTVTTLQQETESFASGADVAAIAVSLEVPSHSTTATGDIYWLEHAHIPSVDGSAPGGIVVYHRGVTGDLLDGSTDEVLLVSTQNLPAELALQPPVASVSPTVWASMSARPLDGGMAPAFAISSNDGGYVAGADVVGGDPKSPLFYADNYLSQLYVAPRPEPLTTYTGIVTQIRVSTSPPIVFYLINVLGAGGMIYKLGTTDPSLAADGSFGAATLLASFDEAETPTRIDLGLNSAQVYVCTSAGHVFAIDVTP